MGTGKVSYYQLRMGTVQPPGNKETWAAQGSTGLSRDCPSLQADSSNLPLLELFVSGLGLSALIFETAPSQEAPDPLLLSTGFLHLSNTHVFI